MSRGDVMKTFVLRATTTTAPIDRSDRDLSGRPRRTRGPRGALVTCLMTAAGMSIVSNVGHAYTDDVCVKHFADTDPKTHDPRVEVRVELFALQLLAGDPRFSAQRKAYQQERRKGPHAPASRAIAYGRSALSIGIYAIGPSRRSARPSRSDSVLFSI